MGAWSGESGPSLEAPAPSRERALVSDRHTPAMVTNVIIQKNGESSETCTEQHTVRRTAGRIQGLPGGGAELPSSERDRCAAWKSSNWGFRDLCIKP